MLFTRFFQIYVAFWEYIWILANQLEIISWIWRPSKSESSEWPFSSHILSFFQYFRFRLESKPELLEEEPEVIEEKLNFNFTKFFKL